MITRETILDLIDKAQNPSISIFIPTHRKGEEVQQDPIRFKNALKEARKQLKGHETDPALIDELLSEPQKLLDNPGFWQHNDHGLAVFITENFFTYYRVPRTLQQQVLVEDHFMITPLLPMISLDGTFCILALSQKNVQLLRATRESTEILPLNEAATSLKEFRKFNVTERHLQHHSGEGTGTAIFHGQGGGDDDEQKEVENYIKQIEHEVTSILKKQDDPLIVAGVEEAVARYRKANHYQRLMDEAICENPDPLSASQLKDKGWKIIQSYFLKDMYDALDQYSDLTGTEKHSNNLSYIVEASNYGKVDSLFVAIGEQSWGWFDSEKDIVHHSPAQENGEHELINISAIKTLEQGGNVYALERDEMPQEASVAAIFRYA